MIARLPAQDTAGISTTSSITLSYGSTPTVGNTMIATVYANVGLGLGTISGWTLISSEAFSGVAQSVEIWARVVQAGDTASVTYSGATGATILRMHMYEYSGLASSITTDGTPTGNTSGVTNVQTIASGNVTTTNANDLLIIACATGGSSNTQAFDSSFNIRQTDASAIRLFDADMIVSSTGTYGSNASWITSLRAGICIVALQAAAGGGVTVKQLTALGVG